MHNRSIVTSPDGASKVNQIICASDSYKFYTPVALANHGTDTVGSNAGQIARTARRRSPRSSGASATTS